MANLLTGDDANFDVTKGAWDSNVNTVEDRVTTPVQAGAGALRLTRSATGGFTAFSDFETVTPGLFYVGSAWARTAVTTRLCQAFLYWYDASDVFIELTNGGFIFDTTTYQYVQVTGSAPGNAAKCRLVIGWANSAVSEIHYIDTVSIEDTAPTTGGNEEIFTATTTWLCPSVASHGYDVTEVLAECWAGGGGGGTGNVINGGGGGGGGGAYARSTLTVVPGTLYTVTVGLGGANGAPGVVGGDSWFSSAATILAKGGGPGIGSGGGGAGGTVAASIGTFKFAGGAGGPGSATEGGAGGGGAGDANAGTAGGDGANPGIGGAADGGNGGNGGTVASGGLIGNVRGGGGGGGAAILTGAQFGARGEVRLNPTKFGVTSTATTEHVCSISRALSAARTANVITEHVTSLGPKVITKAPFNAETEHVMSQQKVITKAPFEAVTEHVTDFNRQLLASREFDVVTEHVTSFSRALVVSREFDVTTEHVMDFGKIVQYVRTFTVTTEHVVSARIELDIEDLPTSGGGPTIIKKFFPVIDDF